MLDRVTALCLLCGATAAAQPAEESVEPVRLVVSRGEGAEACPSEDLLAHGIATRLGYDPFRVDARRRVEVHIERADDATEATVRLFAHDGAAQGTRSLHSEGDEQCQEMSRSIELTVAIAIDPLGRGPRRVATTAVADDPVLARFAAFALFAIGTAPLPTGALAISGGAQWRSLSLDLEARIEIPIEAGSAVGSFDTWLTTFALVPCGHWEVLAACPIVRGGPLRTTGHAVSGAQDVTNPWLALGARVALEIPVDVHVRLGGVVELDAILTQTNVFIGTTRVYATEPLAGSAGFAIWVLP